MSDRITTERIEKLKTQVPPGTPKGAWISVISQELWPDKYCSEQRAAVNNHILRCLIADADSREAAQPKPPPLPPCPEGVSPETWETYIRSARNVARGRDSESSALFARILESLNAYRPGEPSVPPEAYVQHFPHLGDKAYQACLPGDRYPMHPTKDAAVAAVVASWAEWRRNNP